jgi:hypothetical protein
MSSFRAAVALAMLILSLSPAFGQPAPKGPVCSQSMIVGTWQALFAPGVSKSTGARFSNLPQFHLFDYHLTEWNAHQRKLHVER